MPSCGPLGAGRGLGKEIFAIRRTSAPMPGPCGLPSTVTVARVFAPSFSWSPWYPRGPEKCLHPTADQLHQQSALCAHGTPLLLPGVSVPLGDSLMGWLCRRRELEHRHWVCSPPGALSEPVSSSVLTNTHSTVVSEQMCVKIWAEHWREGAPHPTPPHPTATPTPRGDDGFISVRMYPPVLLQRFQASPGQDSAVCLRMPLGPNLGKSC